MDLDDDGRVAPRELPPRQRGERLVRALGEYRVGRPVAQLAGDAGGQRAVEQRPVERGHGGAALERERAVAGRRVARRGGENAQREPLLERRELPLERPVQRKPVASAPDHEDARLHGSRSPTIACTIRRRIRGSASSSTDGAAAAERRAKRVVVDEAVDGGGDRGDVARRDEQAVLPVANDLRDSAHRRRDHRRSP